MIIAVLNQSNRYAKKPNIVATMVAAVNIQLQKHVCPAWGLSAWQCIYYPDPKKVPIGAYRIWLLDDADQANALGYHDQDPNGVPYGRVFVNTTIDYGGTDYSTANSVSMVLSHEACEIVGDPEVNCWRQKGGYDISLVCQELCDPVQEQGYTILVNNKDKVYVSNFVLPAWFDYAPVKNAKFDYLGKLKSEFSMSLGGYMIVIENGAYKNVFGSQQAEGKLIKNASKQHPAARSFKRMHPKK